MTSRRFRCSIPRPNFFRHRKHLRPCHDVRRRRESRLRSSDLAERRCVTASRIPTGRIASMACRRDRTSFTCIRCRPRSRDKRHRAISCSDRLEANDRWGQVLPSHCLLPRHKRPLARALTVSPGAGSVIENINFAVRASQRLWDPFGGYLCIPGQSAVKPPYLSPNIPYPFILAAGSDCSRELVAQGLSGWRARRRDAGLRPYSPAPTSYPQIDFDVRTLSFSADSPRHLVFSQNGDIYVLPAAFFHVEKLPPAISSVIPLTDGRERRRNHGNQS